jgi:hypothetical protein
VSGEIQAPCEIEGVLVSAVSVSCAYEQYQMVFITNNYRLQSERWQDIKYIKVLI